MARQMETEIYYPESDGQPMGETELHRQLLTELVDVLSRWLEGRPNAHVSGNVFIYYVQGDPSRSVCPDVFVALGSHKRLVNTYKTWEDGPFPQVVIELTSRSTRAQDEGSKRELYERLGVLEYYLFDPRFDPEDLAADDDSSETGTTGILKRYRRSTPGALFGPLETAASGIVWHSTIMPGLGFTVQGQALRLVDQATGRVLPTAREEAYAQARAREAAEERAQAAEAARQAEASARQDEVRARQAEAKARQAEAKARQAAEERAQALAEELARLRAERAQSNED